MLVRVWVWGWVGVWVWDEREREREHSRPIGRLERKKKKGRDERGSFGERVESKQVA